jgi:hypothetical protein
MLIELVLEKIKSQNKKAMELIGDIKEARELYDQFNQVNGIIDDILKKNYFQGVPATSLGLKIFEKSVEQLRDTTKAYCDELDKLAKDKKINRVTKEKYKQQFVDFGNQIVSIAKTLQEKHEYLLQEKEQLKSGVIPTSGNLPPPPVNQTPSGGFGLPPPVTGLPPPPVSGGFGLPPPVSGGLPPPVSGGFGLPPPVTSLPPPVSGGFGLPPPVTSLPPPVSGGFGLPPPVSGGFGLPLPVTGLPPPRDNPPANPKPAFSPPRTAANPPPVSNIPAPSLPPRDNPPALNTPPVLNTPPRTQPGQLQMAPMNKTPTPAANPRPNPTPVQPVLPKPEPVVQQPVYTPEPVEEDVPPPPPQIGEWMEATAPDGRIYYFNTATRETSWSKPY